MALSGADMEVRPARAGDAAEITRLSEELGYPAAAKDMAERLAALLQRPEHGVVVAESDGKLLGWAAVEVRTLLVSGRKAELMGLVVDSKARRRGVGLALVRAAEEWVRKQGIDLMTVRSNVVRAESHPFYERLGYTHTKSQHVYRKRFDGT